MKNKVLRGLLVILLGYLLLAAAYFFYLEAGGDPSAMSLTPGSNRDLRLAVNERAEYLSVQAASSSVRNYASELELPALSGAAMSPSPSPRPLSDHKYEKVGSLNATTTQFGDDEKAARAAIKGFRGILQEEALNGVAGARSLQLTIGVPPGEFDAAVAALQKIGKAQGYWVTKTDKTNDYLQLRAKSASLIKTRDALVALKTQGGKIEELVKLERDILDLEEKIQGLGVQLGVFDQVNELCTVRYGLSEVQAKASRPHPHWDRVFAALGWASGTYLSVLAAAAVGLLCLVLALVVAQKGKAILGAADGK